MSKIKTALLAYGDSGKLFHAPFLNVHHGFELIGALERSKKNIENDFDNVRSFSSLEEVLESEAELIIINTPVHTHFDLTKKCLLAGKNVLVEKCFTTTFEEAIELDHIAKNENVKLCIYQNRRWDSDFKTVQKILNENILGEIVEAEIRFERYNPILSAKSWKEKKQDGSGILWDLGSHIIDQALVLFGFPTHLFADLQKMRQDTEVVDYFDILLYYPDKRVRLKATFFAKEVLPAYVLQGRNGSFLKKRADLQEEDLKLGKTPNYKDWGTEDDNLKGILNVEENRSEISSSQGNYLEFFDELYHSILENKPVPVSAEDAIKTMKIVEASIKSSEEKRVIYL